MLHDFLREKSENKNLFFNDPSPHIDTNNKVNENNDDEDDEIKITIKEKRKSLTRMSSTLEGILTCICI
jgi:hypothetical protein